MMPETTFGIIMEYQIERGDFNRHYKAGLVGFRDSEGGWVTVYARDTDRLELGMRVETELDKQNRA
jgi:hypothetical protein